MNLDTEDNKRPSILLWRDIFDISDKVCKHFDLHYSKLVPQTGKKAWWYGETRACKKCTKKARELKRPDIEKNCEEKILSLRIHYLHKPNKPLRASTIFDTLAHELAHLREWNHGSAHTNFTKEILAYIKELGY